VDRRTQELLSIKTEIEALHKRVFTVLMALDPEVRTAKVPIEVLCDAGFLLKKSAETIKDVHTSLESLSGVCQSAAAMKQLKMYYNETTCPRINGEVSIGGVEMKMRVRLPTPRGNPDEYAALCQYIGIKPEFHSRGLARLHWPAVCDWLTELQELGQPTPPGLLKDSMYPSYSLRMRGVASNKESED